MPVAPSLIVTVRLDTESQLYFNALRNRYYPAYCNYTAAHITLLHRLPPGMATLDETMQQLAKIDKPQLELTGIHNIGNGVIFNLASNGLQALHKNMQTRFNPFLITKDRRDFNPHITVQNRVTAYKAAQTFQLLAQQFKPFVACSTGIEVWQYLKGPWLLQQFYPFVPTAELK